MNYFSKYVLLFILFVGCTTNSKNLSQLSKNNMENNIKENRIFKVRNLIDYHDKNANLMIQNLEQAKKDRPFTILHFGDSHIAADFLSGEIRAKLQSIYGVGNLGWFYPIGISAQRSALLSYETSNISSIDSKFDDYYDFPMGGVIAKLFNNSIVINPKDLIFDELELSLLLKISEDVSINQNIIIEDRNGEKLIDVRNNKSWEIIKSKVQLPITVKTDNKVLLGGVWLNNNKKGVSLSIIARNGAQQSIMNKWNYNTFLRNLEYSNPDLVILSYGTNEAFNSNLDIDSFKYNYIKTVRNIRKATPKAVIIIFSAPSTLKKTCKSKQISSYKKKKRIIKTVASCSFQTPEVLAKIIEAQREVAQKENTLFWDWNGAMGGYNSMVRWQNMGLGRKDGVHFSKEGYIGIANSFLKDFLEWVELNK